MVPGNSEGTTEGFVAMSHLTCRSYRVKIGTPSTSTLRLSWLTLVFAYGLGNFVTLGFPMLAGCFLLKKPQNLMLSCASLTVGRSHVPAWPCWI